MNKLKVVYSPKVVAEIAHEVSPSAIKPKLLAEYLQKDPELSSIVEFVEPEPINQFDMCRCHSISYVDDIMNLRIPNGFGIISQEVVDSLPWTNGAMYTAAKLALTEKKTPVCAAVAGFHHAGFKGFEGLGYFCTFNGLMIAAMKLIEEGDSGGLLAPTGPLCQRVAIVDCDMHWGNGTDNILDIIDPNRDRYINLSFGKIFGAYSHGWTNDYIRTVGVVSQAYLDHFTLVKQQLESFKPDIVIYQSGADVHINDPMGGILIDEEMYQRDVRMFTIAKNLNIPVAWTLAGGYQKDENGGCSYVLKLHANTFKAAKAVYLDNPE